MQQFLWALLLLVPLRGTYDASALSDWRVLPDSKVTFKVKNFGVNVNGTLGGLEASIRFSPDDLAKASIEASLDATTINTGIVSRDKHLRKEDYFYVEKYPTIRMQSRSFTQKNGNEYEGIFDLTIRNVTKQVSFPFQFVKEGIKARFKGEFKINRREFEIGGGSLVLGNQVTIQLDVLCQPI